MFFVVVGQGDSLLVESPEGIVVVDGGPNKNFYRFFVNGTGPFSTWRHGPQKPVGHESPGLRPLQPVDVDSLGFGLHNRGGSSQRHHSIRRRTPEWCV